MSIRRTTSATVFVAALAGSVALAPAASATDIEVIEVAACSKGSTITLTGAAGGGRVAITVTVDGSGARHAWGVGLADNLTGVYAGVRLSGSNGDVSVSRSTADQSGTDNLSASAIDFRTGEVCVATLPIAG